MRYSIDLPVLLAVALFALCGCGQRTALHSQAEARPATATGSGEREAAPGPSAPLLAVVPEEVPPQATPGEPASPKQPALVQAAAKPGPQDAAAQSEETTTEFRFPDDAGGALLRKILPPRVSLAAILERTDEPRHLSGPGSIEHPTGLPGPTLNVVRLAPLSPRGALVPQATLTEELPGSPAAPIAPAPVVFPTGPKTRAERPDPAETPSLPLLAAFVPDRASLEDATRAQSLTAVIAAPIPVRQTAVPFSRQSIPDPFENRRDVRFTHPEPEPSQPLAGTPRVP